MELYQRQTDRMRQKMSKRLKILSEWVRKGQKENEIEREKE